MPKLYEEECREDIDGAAWAAAYTHPEPAISINPTLAAVHSESAVDENGYVHEWSLIASAKRFSVNYRCEVCGIFLKERPYLLHVHHLSRDKLDNDSINLQALCVICHAASDGHGHMLGKIAKDDLKYMHDLRESRAKNTLTAADPQPKNSFQEEALSTSQKGKKLAGPPVFKDGALVRHKVKRYVGLVEGFTKLKHLLELPSDEIGYRVTLLNHTANSPRQIASPSNLELWTESSVEQQHKDHLAALGIEWKGTRQAQDRTTHSWRITHCWNCKHPLDNFVNPECVACAWILCNCGACGCRHNR